MTAHLAFSLARLRLRLALRRTSAGRGATGARAIPAKAALTLLALLAPVAYVGLFANALAVIGEVAGPAIQTAALTVFAGTITLASFTAKVARGEAVSGAGGENEFLLAHPVGLPALVVASSLAGIVTDVFDALFLMPILIAAAVVWQLPAWAIPVAALTSIAAQVAISAAALAAQILVVTHVRPPARRLCWTLLSLVAAAAMALLWTLGSRVLRAPAEVAAALAPRVALLVWSPAHLLAAPLAACRAGEPLQLAGALLALTAVAATATATAWAVARRCTRHGWEQAGATWAESSRFAPAATGRPLGLFRKDWRLMLRERRQLVALIALPALIVGLLVFGSAGWSWSTATPERMALLAYSLAAYAATLGPLRHMEAERHAFWLLRSVPQPLARLLGWKALFWSSFVGGLATAVYTALALLRDGALPAGGLAAGLLAVLGAVTVSFLAVALAAGSADLADDRRSAVGVGTALVFMLVAGLYNMVLLAPAGTRAPLLALYLIVTGVVWWAGIERAEAAFDPERAEERAPSAIAGAMLAILLLVGSRAGVAGARATGAAGAAVAFEVAWAGLLALLAAVFVLRSRRRDARGWPASLAVGLALGLAGGLAGRLASTPAGAALPPLAAASLVLRPLVEELALRGLVQGGLDHGRSRRAGVLACVASSLAALVLAWPLRGPASVAGAVLPALAFALTRRWPAAFAARALIVGLTWGG